MTVILEQGTLQGLHYKTQLSKKSYVRFLGIPYAKPPINKLRFKSPVKHPGCPGVLKAFSEGKQCMQFDTFIRKIIVGSEDCLYLNVFVPQEESVEKKSVMVFIHGGAFRSGSGSLDMYSPDNLLDENVIVVTINYRLNVFGFLNLGIDACPGNMGLKDQLLALKWVRDNISVFGGDAGNITIFGESAGSASVHYHMISPQSKEVFQKAIMQSGCVFDPWAFNEKHEEAAFKLAAQLGCQKDDPKEVVEYLLNVRAVDLAKSTTKFKIEGQRDIFNFPFVPSVENDGVIDQFLPARPEVLIKTATPLPVITGINSIEGMIIFANIPKEQIFDFHKTEEIRKLFDNDCSKEFINKIRDFYFKEKVLESETLLENTCNMLSDVFFTKEFYRSFYDLLEKNIAPVYNYEFKYDGGLNVGKQFVSLTKPYTKRLKGACHADELGYLFYVKLLRLSPKANSEDYKMCRTMSKLWCNFAKYGDPNSSDLSFRWEKTKANKPKYLSINGDNTRMVDELLISNRIEFWENILKMAPLKQNL